MFRLYFNGQFVSAHDDFAGAEAQSRWAHFERNLIPWEEFRMPPGFMILIPGDGGFKFGRELTNMLKTYRLNTGGSV